MNHIYKIVIWDKNEMHSEVDCKIYSDDVAQTISEAHLIDYNHKVNPEYHYDLKYVKTSEKTAGVHKIKHFNKANNKFHGM